jgi:hypothetical protein
MMMTTPIAVRIMATRTQSLSTRKKALTTILASIKEMALILVFKVMPLPL